MYKRRAQQGFTLIEVLITVIILAIGLLGLAGLQANSLRFNHSAYQNSQATALAYEIADRMRANRDNATAGNYDIAIGAGPPGGGTVAATDLTDWKTALAALLPNGDGSIVRNGTLVEVTVQWVDTPDPNDPDVAIEQLVFRTEL